MCGGGRQRHWHNYAPQSCHHHAGMYHAVIMQAIEDEVLIHAQKVESEPWVGAGQAEVYLTPTLTFNMTFIIIIIEGLSLLQSIYMTFTYY